MEPQSATPAVTSVLAGLLTRASLSDELRKSERTLIRWEHAGMPVIRVGMTRLYDPAAVRAWLLTHERRHDVPKRGRPANKVAA